MIREETGELADNTEQKRNTSGRAWKNREYMGTEGRHIDLS